MFHGSYFLVIILAIFRDAVRSDILSSGSQRLMSIPMKGCEIPESEDHYYLSLSGKILNSKKHLLYGTGQSAVIVKCFDPMKISRAPDFALCFDGKWYPSDHSCVMRTCYPVHDSHSAVHSCTTHEGLKVSCELPATPYTRITTQCAHWRFSVPATYNSISQAEGICLTGGYWTKINECRTQCGLIFNTNSSSTSQNNAMSKVLHEYPWHVVIYRLKDNKLYRVCGGTMVTVFVIITAADCIFENGKNVLASELKVAVGKYYRDFSTAESSSRIHDVLEVFTNSLYTVGIVTVSEYIENSDTVGEVCVGAAGWDMDELHGKIGHIAAWKEDGTGSTTRVGKSLKYVSNVECQSSQEMKGELRADQFCSFSKDDREFVPADIGGGLVFQMPDGRFYLKGILTALFFKGRNAVFTDWDDKLRFFFESYVTVLNRWLYEKKPHWSIRRKEKNPN